MSQIDSQGNEIQFWQYDEAVVTQEEYAQYDTIVMEIVQEEINSMASEQEKKNAVMQANIEYIAMMADVDLEE